MVDKSVGRVEGGAGGVVDEAAGGGVGGGVAWDAEAPGGCAEWRQPRSPGTLLVLIAF